MNSLTMKKYDFFRGCVALAALVLAGCQDKPGPSVAPSNADAILRVRAEDWADFSEQQADKSPGWVAFPVELSTPEYHSSIDPQALGILPAQECLGCHDQHVRGFEATAHARTSREATAESILGSLAPPDNRVVTQLPGFEFETIKQDSGIVQRVKTPHSGNVSDFSVPLAFTVGSGNHGQSFLAWHQDQLCQTPISFMTEANRWGNSPGSYSDGTADFSRPATSRCMDCHNTWFGHAVGSVNRYDKGHWILGVSCVRCHGPARDHVRYHRQFPEERQAQEIVNPRNLTRERANEVCAQCHSGGGELRRPAFTYKPGEPLEKWIALNLSADDPGNDDPHAANQLGRMMRSACYQKSGTLTCMDCHDPHEQERGRTELFSQRCLSCHNSGDCGLSTKHSDKLAGRCIECHMPSRRDVDVTSHGAGGPVMPLLRDHLIGIWPDVSRAVEQKWIAPAP